MPRPVITPSNRGANADVGAVETGAARGADVKRDSNDAGESAVATRGAGGDTGCVRTGVAA